MSLTEEETNYLRLAILVIKLSPKALRILFDIKFPPADLGNILLTKSSKLQGLQRQRIINQAQWELLYPPTGTSSSDKYDLTLMICLLRNICTPPITKPPTGFDRLPPNYDSSEGADLARMKYYRNFIAHSNVAEICRNDFEDAWKNLTQANIRISGGQYSQDCSDLRVARLDGSDKEIYNEVLSTKQELEILKQETIKWNVLQLHQKKIEEWEKKDEKYVHTEVTGSVMDAVQSNQCLLITGNSGSGKSALVHHVALELQKLGNTILVIKKPVELIWYHNPNESQIVVCDDICGKYYADKALIEEWIRYEDDIKLILENCDIHLLFNSRLIVSQDEHFKMMSFLSPFVVNLNSSQYQFSLSERKDMLSVHLGQEIHVSDESLQSQDCFPLLCELFGKKDESSRNDPEKFFSHPFEEYRKDLEKLRIKEPLKFCSLALLVLFEDSIEEALLTDFDIKPEVQDKLDSVCHVIGTARGSPRTKMKEELESLENVYCRKSDGKFKSLHDKMFDFLSASIGPFLGECFLKYSSCGFIRERIRLLSALPCDDENVIVLTESSEHSYFQRMFSEIMKGNIKDVFFNKQMTQEAFEEALVRELRKLSETEFKNLIEKKGKYPSLTVRSKFLLDSVSALGKVTDDLDEVAKFHLNYTYSLLYQKDSSTLHWIMARGLHKVFLCVEERLPQYVKRAISDNYNLCISLAILEQKTDILESIFGKYPVSSIDGDNAQYYPLFLYVCFTGSLKIVKFLHEKNRWNHIMTETGESAVWLASFSGQIDVVKFLVSQKFDTNASNNEGATPLFIASQRGHVEIVEFLLQNQADVNLCKTNGTSPLFIACQEGHIEIVKCLLENNADVNKCKVVKSIDAKQDHRKKSQNNKKETERGISPLFIACKNEHLKIVETLLDNHANTELCTPKGKTPLIISLQNQSKEIANLLIDQRADINHVMDNGLGPLTIVSGNGDIQMLTKLLDKSAYVNIESVENCSDGSRPNIPSPLTMAAINNHLEVAKMLIARGADIDYRGVEGATALFEASDKGHYSFVEFLLSKNASVDMATHVSRTPLFVAVQRKFVDIAELLLKNGANVNICRNDGTSPLLMATLRNYEQLVRLLLEYKADPDIATHEGHSPLIAAAKLEDPAVLKLLIKANTKVNCIDSNNRTPLWVAALHGNLECMKILIENNADINIIDKNFDSVLHCAVTSGNVSAVELLIEVGSDMNSSNNAGTSPLIRAVQYNYVDIVNCLLTNGALVNLNRIDGKSALVLAVENSSTEIVKILCDNGALLNNHKNPHDSVLWKAILQGDTKIVEILLEKGVNIYEYVNGESPLDLARRLNHEGIYKLLQQKQGKFIQLFKTVGKLTLYYSYIDKFI